MKKISKIKISDRYGRTKWYVKLLFSLLICAAVVMIAALIKFYFDVNKDNNAGSETDNNMIVSFDSVKSNYTIFRSEDGMAGVKDSDDRYIIEPRWQNIYFLNSGRFAVSQKENGKVVMGIIDSDENFITPFIFERLVSIGKDYIAGYFSDEEGFALLDTSGDMISDKIWKSFVFDDKSGVISLTSDTGKYSYLHDGNMLICTSVSFSDRAGGCEVNFSCTDEQVIENIGENKVYSIFDTVCAYFQYIISHNVSDISDITDERFFSSISTNDLFKNCSINGIENLKLAYKAEDTESYEISAEVSYDYEDGENVINDLRSLITLTLVNDSKHSVILKSVNKEEL
ncbi:MAG: hypothetical protein ACI4JB_10810 [Porcipelethomonas sp.]